jgi:ElaB/YqjD/DUF883 family membrane-anchored ribosome-binding protein
MAGGRTRAGRPGLFSSPRKGKSSPAHLGRGVGTLFAQLFRSAIHLRGFINSQDRVIRMVSDGTNFSKEKIEMSENRPTGGNTGSGLAGTGNTDAGTTRDTTNTSYEGLTTTGGGSGTQGGQTTGTGTAAALAQTAKEYGGKIADAASTAKDYVSDKASVVTDKIKDLSNRDFSEVANEAKEYARKNPGQAILISAAAGLVLGLLIRGSRR